MKKFILGLISFGPVVALAQASGGASASGVESGLHGVGTSIINILNNTVIPILFAVAVVYFLYGVVKFVMSAGDEEKRKEGKNAMIWGIVGLVVMVSLYGLLGFLSTSLGLTSSGTVTLPTVTGR